MGFLASPGSFPLSLHAGELVLVVDVARDVELSLRGF